MSVKPYGDKYEFYMDNHTLKCKRYGEDWRSFTGDGAVLALYLYVEELEERLSNLENKRCNCVTNDREKYNGIKDLGEFNVKEKEK